MSAPRNTRYVGEVHVLMKNIGTYTDGQVSFSSFDDADVSSFVLEVAPKGGPYEHGKFLFQVSILYLQTNE